MLRILALIYFIVLSIGIFLLGNLKVERSEALESIWPQILNIRFWRLYLGEIVAIIPGFYVIATYKNFGKHTIDDDMFLTIVGSCSSVCNGLFRFVWAYFM